MKNIIISLMLALFIFSGCAMKGTSYNYNNNIQLKPGVTTATETIKLMEADPISKTVNVDGSYTLRWNYSYGYIIGIFAQAGERDLIVLFDKNDKMVSIIYQAASGPEVFEEKGYERTGTELTPF